MILTGREIEKRLGKDIHIKPFDPKKLNPNSYNLSLHDELVVYEDEILDMKVKPKTRKIKIPPEGLVLEPGKLYLGRTVEYTKTNNLMPKIDGRSSIGRLGIFVHVTAGFGDIGFEGTWTLEILCVQPVRIYPFTQVAQISYNSINGDTDILYNGRYNGQIDARESRFYNDYKQKESDK